MTPPVVCSVVPAGATPPKYVNPDDPTQTWSGRGKERGWSRCEPRRVKAWVTIWSPAGSRGRHVGR